jgi:hypothetical protein
VEPGQTDRMTDEVRSSLWHGRVGRREEYAYQSGWTVKSEDWTVKFKFGKDALRIFENDLTDRIVEVTLSII